MKLLVVFAGCMTSGGGSGCTGRFCMKIRGCDCDPSSNINDHCCETGGGKHVCCHTKWNGFKGKSPLILKSNIEVNTF